MIANVKKLIFAFCLLSVPFIAVNAQSQKDSVDNDNYRFFIAMVPQYVAVNALRIDFAYSIKPKQAFVISPRLYTAQEMNPLGNAEVNDFSNLREFNYDLVGFGAEISQIFFLDGPNASERFYHGYNVHYTYYDLSYQLDGFIEDFENGLPVFVPGVSNEKINIQQFGVGYLIGYQYLLSNQVFVDIFAGLGVKYANLKDSNTNSQVESEQRKQDFEKGFINYAYQGTHVNAGVKVGVKF